MHASVVRAKECCIWQFRYFFVFQSTYGLLTSGHVRTGVGDAWDSRARCRRVSRRITIFNRVRVTSRNAIPASFTYHCLICVGDLIAVHKLVELRLRERSGGCRSAQCPAHLRRLKLFIAKAADDGSHRSSVTSSGSGLQTRHGTLALERALRFLTALLPILIALLDAPSGTFRNRRSSFTGPSGLHRVSKPSATYIHPCILHRTEEPPRRALRSFRVRSIFLYALPAEPASRIYRGTHSISHHAARELHRPRCAERTHALGGDDDGEEEAHGDDEGH